MGTPEIVVKRAWPCSSRLMPVGAPIGFSGGAEGRDFFCSAIKVASQQQDLEDGLADGKVSVQAWLCPSSNRSCLSVLARLMGSRPGSGGSIRGSRFRARELPDLGVFPGDIHRVVEVQEQTFASVEKAEAKEVVVEEGKQGRRTMLLTTESALRPWRRPFPRQAKSSGSCARCSRRAWGRNGAGWRHDSMCSVWPVHVDGFVHGAIFEGPLLGGIGAVLDRARTLRV